MTSPTNDVIEKNILPETITTKRQRAGDEDSGGSEASVGFVLALAYFLNVFIGCGVYAFPEVTLYACYKIWLLTFIYAIVSSCLYILITNANGSKTYPEFVQKSFDSGDGGFPKASKVFRIFIIIFGFAFSICVCSIYLIFIATHVSKVIFVAIYYDESNPFELITFVKRFNDLECRWSIPVVAIILLVLCFLPIWSKIALYIVALIGISCQLIVIMLALAYVFEYDDVSKFALLKTKQDISDIFIVQSIAIYAGEGINLIFPLLAAMKEPDKFIGCPSLLCCGTITAKTVAIIFAAAGSRRLHFYLHLCRFQTLYYNTVFEKVLKLLAALSLMCTYPMQLDAAYHYIADEFNIDNKKAAQYGLRALLVVVTIAFALIPDVYLIYFMGIIGSLCLSLLVLIVPGLIPFCTKNYGKIYWMAIVGVLAIIIGILIFFGGTITMAMEWHDYDSRLISQPTMDFQ